MSGSGVANLPGLKRSVKKTAEKDTPSPRGAGEKRKRDAAEEENAGTKRTRTTRGRSEQASSASPILTRTMSTSSDLPPDGETFPVRREESMTFAQFKEYMEADREKQLIAIRNEVGNQVSAIASRVDSNTNDITEIKETLKSMESGKRAHLGGNDEEVKYCIARRSLRMWPVKGSTEEEIWNSTGDFVHEILGVPGDEIDQEGIESVRRMRSGRPGQSIRDEVLVRFVDADTRDLVNSYARNLGSHVDNEGRPTAGIRTEVPYHLRGLFKILDDHGHELRTRYGRDFKRHVKFDDQMRNFYLSVKMPGARYWERISASFVFKQMSLRENSHENARSFGKTFEQGARVEVSIPRQQPPSGTGPIRSGFSSDGGGYTSAGSGGTTSSTEMRRPRWGAVRK